MDIEKHCKKCVHCVAEGETLRCHRNPPICSPYGDSFFPRIPANFSYCGEFKAIETEKTIIEELEELKEKPVKTAKTKTQKTKKEKSK